MGVLGNQSREFRAGAIPLHGVDPAHVVLANRRDDRNRLVVAFRKYARDQLTGPEPGRLANP
ncbi:hypothetical protein [Nocardia pseudovaccinii]|uniref:hypothetical protein n=1 Tax=Nocardia pseudovaccinii TaxID=189540 RepID=UPI0007A3A841|nr:hypothetical protein [Nocardia pseudovaccinii]